MTDADDDAFVDALRGRRAPDGLDTRRAARLARYFDDHPRGEHRVHHDPQGEAQLLAYLRAQPQPAAEPAAPGLLARLKAWLLPPQGWGLPQLGGAVAVLALAVGVFQITRTGTDEDDGLSMKGLPPVLQLGASAALPAPQLVPVADPQRAAQGLQGQLAALGVQASVTSVTGGSPGWLVQAQVPAERRAAVAPVLDAQGLLLDGQGRLAVQFQASRP